MSFGMLGASTLPSWGTLGRSWDDPGTLGSNGKDTADLGHSFRKIFGYIWKEKHEFSIFISRFLFLMIFGSESGGLGTNFHDFCCPGEWLEIG